MTNIPGRRRDTVVAEESALPRDLSTNPASPSISNSLLNSVFESLDSGLMVLDPDGRILMVNREGRELLSKFSLNPETGMRLHDLLGEKAAASFMDLRKGEFSFRNELTLPFADGADRTIGFTVNDHRDFSGRSIGRVVSFRDITNVQSMQRKMERMNRLATLAEIGAAVAHEIRNPLAGIKTMAQSIGEKLNAGDEKKEYIRRILNQVNRLDELLKAFFSYARPAHPKIRPSSFIEIMQEVKALVGNALSQKGISLAERYETNLPLIMVDPNQVQQVMLNLMLNSVDAVSRGGEISVSAACDPLPEGDALNLTGPSTEKDSVVTVNFIDNGTGIDDHVLERVFEPFFTTKHDGSGLGLSIVDRILDENAAYFKISSKKGKGTAFLIRFRARHEAPRVTGDEPS